jgi:hypothetical protein
MTNDENKFFPTNFLEGFMGQLVTWNKPLYCMHAWNNSSDQNTKTLKGAKNLKKDDGCSQNGVED